jgi:hypothetical protein
MMENTPRDATMEAGGYYNRHSVLQAAAAELGSGWLAEAAAAVPLVASAPLAIADYGAAQGHNSMRPLTAAVAALRARTDAPIAVVHTDLPGNDFSAVFEAVDHDDVSYLRGHPDVFPYAIGRSFYSRLFPAGSVQLGWSAITTHWLSRRPAVLDGHVSPDAAPATERAPFSAQAAEDWAEFLWNRSAELAPGGRVVMVEPCTRPDGSLPGARGTQLMDEIVAELVDEGLLGESQALEMTLPVYVRTPEEYLGPLETAGEGGLQLLRSEIVQAAPNPFLERFEATGDARAYAEAMAGSTRAWAGHMLFGSLPPDQTDLEDEFFRRYRAKGEVDPGALSQEAWHVVMEFGRPAT